MTTDINALVERLRHLSLCRPEPLGPVGERETERRAAEALAAQQQEIARLRTALREVRDYVSKGLGFGDLIARIDAALAGTAGDGWRPIAEAPKDGTRFLAYEPTYGVGTAFWQEIMTGSYADEVETVRGWRLHGMMFREGDIDQPTHYRPLPTPPAQEDGSC